MGTEKLSQKDAIKRHRKKHRDEGLCNYCSNKAVAGKKHCQYHLDKIKDYHKVHVDKKELVEITEEEYALLNVYKRDAHEIMKFLAIKHHDIYMDICSSKLRKIEDRVLNIPGGKLDEIQ